MKKITLLAAFLLAAMSYGQIPLTNADFQTFPFLSGGGWGVAGSGISHQILQGTVDPRAGGDGSYCVLKVTSTNNSGNYKQFHSAAFTLPTTNQQYGLKFWARGVASTTEEIEVSIIYKYGSSSTTTKKFLLNLSDTWQEYTIPSYVHLKTTATDGVKVRFSIKEGAVAKEIHLDDASFESMDFFIDNFNYKEIADYWNSGNGMVSETYSTDAAHTGPGSLLAVMPDAGYTGVPVVRISTAFRREVLVASETYMASVWVKRKNSVDTKVRVGLLQHDGSTETNFDYPAWTTLTTDAWTQIFSDEITAEIGTLAVEPRFQGDTGNGDFYIDDIKIETVETAGIEDLQKFNFSYAPNPSKDFIRLSAANNIENVEIFNLLGQKMISKELNSTNETVDISNLVNGIYVMNVTIDGAKGSFKIIKE